MLCSLGVGFQCSFSVGFETIKWLNLLDRRSKYLIWRPTCGSELANDEMREELARVRAKRGGNRAVLTKQANKAHDLL